MIIKSATDPWDIVKDWAIYDDSHPGEADKARAFRMAMLRMLAIIATKAQDYDC